MVPVHPDTPGHEPAAWHSLAVQDAAARLDSDVQRGLVPAEAERRLLIHGPNRIETGRATPWWRILVRQFVNPLIALLLRRRR